MTERTNIPYSYRMVYDDGRWEDVTAPTPSAAVAKRRGGRFSLLPHTITNLSVLIRRGEVRAATLYGTHKTPLLDRIAATQRAAALLPGPEAARASVDEWREAWDD